MTNEKIKLLEDLYSQVRNYEDRQWIGFLLARERRLA